MKKCRLFSIILFFILLLLPLAFFNFTPDYVSKIDNRKLASRSDGMTKYVEDRIGFRDQFISGYTLLHDRLFHLMVHPSYEYGEEGYVFFKYKRNSCDTAYMEAFAQSIKAMQDYCESRDVPFLFCMDPEKAAVYTDYLADGYTYSRSGTDYLLKRLNELGVNFIDNTALLKEKSKTEQVFNVKYDAGHWNDLGAFYGTNAILEAMNRFFPSVAPNAKEDFAISTVLQTSLPVSTFPIHAEVPAFSLKKNTGYIDKTDLYKAELSMDKNYHTFWYLVNENAVDAPKALVFQGSYLNSRHQYLQPAFREYIAVHNYQNVLRLDYYFNIFRPDCVIFEATEYTFNNSFFSGATMDTLYFPPAYTAFDSYETVPSQNHWDVQADGGKSLITLRLIPDLPASSLVYLDIDGTIYDTLYNADDNLYTTTIEAANITADSALSLIEIHEDIEQKRLYTLSYSAQ